MRTSRRGTALSRAGILSGRAAAILVCLVLGMVVAGGVAGRMLPDARHRPTSDGRSGGASDTEQRPALCVSGAARCGSVRVPEVGDVQYATVPGHSPGAGLVLVEMGGPGLDMLARADPGDLGLPGALRAYDLLLVREPWAGRQKPAGCEQAVRRFGAAIAGGGDAPALLREGGCPLPTWDARAYAGAVRAILHTLGRPLAGIIGQSFGALPAWAAAQAEPAAWLLLNAPIAPAGYPGAAVVRDRAAAIERALDRSYVNSCRPAGLDCAAPASAPVAAAVARVGSVRVAGRLQALGRGDVALAVLAATYDLRANERWLWETLAKIPNVDTDTWLQLGRLADQVLQRFGDGQVSVQLAAYTAGICRSYGGWSGGPAASPDRPDALLAYVAEQCTRAAPAADAAWPSPSGGRPGQVCVLANDDDPVAPAMWADRWAAELGSSDVLRYRYAGHASLARAAVEATGSTTRCAGLLGQPHQLGQ